ncbi:asparagine synthase (glutamine-hydrolyzing) [Pseudonocardia acaciae]|uniref:asparagine synthase (glutamine-hydrolyzing) n=1 Tax=Pseudonocardia acaciae TaxID=551276 RepID=UPI00048D44F9|nr:asparagine synthase (glutamine-hydrolyzing) [Pseudonocardia acaciae]
MCGIAGWADWERDLRGEAETVAAMTRTLVPRGPDAGDVWVSRRAVLGHRRLAVIDLAGGAQPMAAARPGQDECVITFAGEIYNFGELRSELQGRGHRFRTRSDTEVLLRAYLEWGEDCLPRLNGMFSFAVWDPAAGRLLLARDRLGVKPLYYRGYDGGVVFGSEQKALLAHPLVEPEVDAGGLAELLCLTQTPGHAVFRGIRALRPGHLAVIDRRGVRESCYWRLHSAPHDDDPETTAATVRELLADTVERQLVADVPVGTLLSGGLDSSAVTALASAASGTVGTVASYSIDFAGNDEHFRPDANRPEQDAPFARTAAAHIGSKHTEIVLRTEDVLAAQSEVVTARDLPGLADINAAQYLLFREVKGAVTVALSGEAADEVFGGYAWFHLSELLDGATFPWAVALDGYRPVLDPGLLERLRPREYLADGYATALAEVPRLDGEPAADARIREMFHLTLTRWLTMLLDFKDRMSMRSGLEVRVPFCDHRLLEYAWNVPWALKTLDGRNKGLLRAAVSDLLPAAVLNRRKTSFPVTHHPGYRAALAELMSAELADPNSPLDPLIDRAAVRALVRGRAEPAGWWRASDTLASLLQIAFWLRHYRVRLV